MEKLTKKQRDILAFIKLEISKFGMSPTAVEIGEHFNIYPNGAWLHVQALIKKGAVTYTQGKTRSVQPVKGFIVRIK